MVQGAAVEKPVKVTTADRFREVHRLNLKEFPVEEIAALLSGPENTSRHYIAAFLLTGSREFLDKAAELFPTAPDVFYNIAVNSSDPEEKTRNLKKALSLDPENSYLQLLVAGGLAANGERGEATEFVKKAFDSGAFESFTDSIKTATRELALKAGSSASDAAIISLRGEPDDGSFQLLSALSKLYETEEFKGAAGEDAESLAVSIAVKFQPLSKTHGVVALLANRTERTALQNLPGDSLYGNSGMTVATRIAQIEDETQRLVRNSEVLRRMPELSDSEWQVYVDKWSREGQPEAMSWLAQLKPSE